MQLIIIEKDNIKLFNAFYERMNDAFKARSNDKIPYEPADYQKLLAELNEGACFFAFIEDDNINAGLMLKITDDNIGRIRHVWTHPSQQKKGYAKKLMLEAEKYAKQKNINLLNLSVANNYPPAVNLYKKLGFKTWALYANTAGTYYFLDMIKSIPPYKYSEFKRIGRLVISWIKFNLLFKKDSSPRLLHKMLYGKK